MLIRLLPFLLLAAVAHAATDHHQDELKDLRGRIQSLQQELEQASEDRSEAADALKKSERGISDVNRSLRHLESRQRGLTASLKQLDAETQSTQISIASQQKQLSTLLRERYAQGDGDAMKLLLNGQDPSEVARNLEFYGYIGHARSELIRQYREALTRLEQLQAQTRQKQEALGQVKNERLTQKQSLEAEKSERREVLKKLSDQIERQRKEIGTLVRNEKRLTLLIEQLAKLDAEKPKPHRRGQKTVMVADASLAGLNFTRLKGKLALPLAGEILRRYGQARESGGPAWKGLFIRAGQGAEVHAVGTGKVAFADWFRGFGNLLIIDHGSGYLSLYSNNESLYKQAGEAVRAGDVVATVGATGGQAEPGLYFELRHQGKPFDPLSWVKLK